MTTRSTSVFVGRAAAIAIVGLATFAPLHPASAQGFFESIFGGLRRLFDRPAPISGPFDSMARAVNPPPTQPFVEANPSKGFCVRTCDGHYFPVQAYPGASAAEICRAFCPASATRVYAGSNIDYAVARDGSRYGDLDTAYLYRKQIVTGCSCDGRNPFGLAHIDINRDPTLKPGDVVVTHTGLLAVNGSIYGRADFTPVTGYPGFAKSYREQLSAMRVTRSALRASTEITSVIRPSTRATQTDNRPGTQFAR